MARDFTRLSLVTFALLASGCVEQKNVAMRGNADGVMINYVGDVANTLPIARQHCAQYERVPVLRVNKDNYVTYDCVRPGSLPGISSQTQN